MAGLHEKAMVLACLGPARHACLLFPRLPTENGCQKVKRKRKNLMKNLHPKVTPTGSILFHNFFETDLSVVTTPNRFSQNVADFHY